VHIETKQGHTGIYFKISYNHANMHFSLGLAPRGNLIKYFMLCINVSLLFTVVMAFIYIHMQIKLYILHIYQTLYLKQQQKKYLELIY